MKYHHWLLLTACYLTMLIACSPLQEEKFQSDQTFDWRNDWAVDQGFTLEIDSEGYEIPSAIAFVPNPGPDSDDPLYFVTELRGRVKVVTNDRSVYTFAEDFFQYSPTEELPSLTAQAGLAGICLDPEKGFVFVTFVNQSSNGILRNNIVRFQTEPEHFSLKPIASVEFADIFYDHPTGPSHQIGPCQVWNSMLYVGVGDGYYTPLNSQKLDSIQGKVIRMTLDGKPVSDNPFYVDNDIKNPANFVLSYGHRNPFSLKLIGGRVFVFENGPEIDRFMEIEEGANYLWDGTEPSIGLNANAVFYPSIAPVQMDYYHAAEDGDFPESFADKFYVASSGNPSGIFMLDYSLEDSHIHDTARYIVRLRQSGGQWLSGLSVGPDGLFFAPLMPDQNGRSYILKLTYDPSAEYPHRLHDTMSPDELISQKGCLGCHKLGNRGNIGLAPPLNRESLVTQLDQRLNSETYLQSLTQIDLLDSEPQVFYRQAREEVLAASGMDRIRIWTKYRLLEPRFDNTYSQMPNLNLTEEEAELISNHLLREGATSFTAKVQRWAKANLETDYLPLFSFIAGSIATIVSGVVLYVGNRIYTNKRDRRKVL